MQCSLNLVLRGSRMAAPPSPGALPFVFSGAGWRLDMPGKKNKYLTVSDRIENQEGLAVCESFASMP